MSASSVHEVALHTHPPQGLHQAARQAGKGAVQGQPEVIASRSAPLASTLPQGGAVLQAEMQCCCARPELQHGKELPSVPLQCTKPVYAATSSLSCSAAHRSKPLSPHAALCPRNLSVLQTP